NMGQLMIVAQSKDNSEIILQLYQHYGLVKQGMKPGEIKWGDRDVFEQSLEGNAFHKVDPPKPFKPNVKTEKSLVYQDLSGDLYLDVLKSFHHLDFGHLVKKAVQVKGKNGRTFTRMQWVNPGSASTGHGIRKISSEKEHQQAIKDGVDKHPLYHKALEDQGINWDEHDWKGHPHFYVPETQESAKSKRKNTLNHARDTEFSQSFDKASKQEEDKQKRMKPGTKAVMKQYGATEDLHDYFDEMESQDWNKRTPIQRYHLAKDIATKHWMKTIHPNLKKSIQMEDIDPKIRSMKLSCLDSVQSAESISAITAHPVILRHAVDKILGDITASRVRSITKNANLTLNTYTQYVDKITTTGYKPRQPDKYLEKHVGKEDAEFYREIEESEDLDDDEKLDAISDRYRNLLRTDKTKARMWNSVRNRLEAEMAVGVPFESYKPAYFALNPDGDPKGAAYNSYGDGTCLEVDKSILRDCTANLGDTYYTTRPIPSVQDMNHLNDAHILRIINDKMPSKKDIFNNDDWANSPKTWDVDYSAEVLYHRPQVDPKYFKVVRMGDPDVLGTGKHSME
ncbi:MAG: hypothetical protein Q8910_00710, partial [Bacteroidota bacterium]|nr:hypothetical protein [Bacteroidota bacterium]